MIALVQQGKTAEAVQIIKNEGGRDIDDLITNLDKEFDEAEKALPAFLTNSAIAKLQTIM